MFQIAWVQKEEVRVFLARYLAWCIFFVKINSITDVRIKMNEMFRLGLCVILLLFSS